MYVYYQDNAEMYEVNANEFCSLEYSPCCHGAVLLYTFPHSVSLLKLNTSDLSLSKMKCFREYTGRGFFFFYPLLWFHCMLCGFRGASFGYPKRGVSSKPESCLLEELKDHNLDTAEASPATAPFLVLNWGVGSGGGGQHSHRREKTLRHSPFAHSLFGKGKNKD